MRLSLRIDDGLLGGHVDEAADRELVVDVPGQVGGVEGEDDAPAADGGVQVDHEALVARRVARRSARP